ncbi:ATP-grasp domain-containing protein [Piscinibacter sp.]|uniref:ATP-grasp domain-containing protein n=1 Tax=Piscinibacter sp. TaxID=1903157 RepID=UPI00344440CB
MKVWQKTLGRVKELAGESSALRSRRLTRPALWLRRCAACTSRTVESGIRRGLYASLVTDRASRKGCRLIASSEGGMVIEEVAHSTPEEDHHRTGRPAGQHDRRAGAQVAAPDRRAGSVRTPRP